MFKDVLLLSSYNNKNQAKSSQPVNLYRGNAKSTSNIIRTNFNRTKIFETHKIKPIP